MLTMNKIKVFEIFILIFLLALASTNALAFPDDNEESTSRLVSRFTHFRNSEEKVQGFDRSFSLQDGLRFGTVHWDGRDNAGRTVPSGVYFAVLQSNTGSQLARTKLVLLK